MKVLKLLMLIFIFTFTLGQAIPEGTEVLLTDSVSQTIIGHGKVESAQLELELGEVSGSFILLLALPDGVVETYTGQLSFDERGLVVDVGGQLVGIMELFASRGVSLMMVPVSGDTAPTIISTSPVLYRPGI